MQIKKSPRDPEFGPIPRYESNGYGIEAEEANDLRAPEGFSARRPAAHSPAPAAGPEPPQPAAARTQSVIDRNSSFDGRFETEHDLRVEGTVSGEVICRGTFMVEREATARVRVQARDGHIQGHFEGDIACAGKLVLAATAHLTGTVKAAVLVVEEGATVSGTVDTTQGAGVRPAPAPAAAAQAQNGNGEPATVTRVPRREPPSFALVSSDERPGPDRN